MKLVSWNVNGIRAILNKGFLESIAAIDGDVLCLQEVRATPDQVALDLPGFGSYWNPAVRKGYAGTAVFTKIEPVKVTYGMGASAHDQEGRIITLELSDYFLVNVYTPNSGTDLSRLAYRTGQWDVDFLAYLKKLDRRKPVVFCGDLNVAHKEIDLADPQANQQTAGFTVQERESFERILKAGFIDTFRVFRPEGGHYTWWSYIGRARVRNVGWRIDYFCISEALLPRLKDSSILPEIMGSDHCPVTIRLE